VFISVQPLILSLSFAGTQKVGGYDTILEGQCLQVSVTGGEWIFDSPITVTGCRPVLDYNLNGGGPCSYDLFSGGDQTDGQQWKFFFTDQAGVKKSPGSSAQATISFNVTVQTDFGPVSFPLSRTVSVEPPKVYNAYVNDDPNKPYDQFGNDAEDLNSTPPPNTPSGDYWDVLDHLSYPPYKISQAGILLYGMVQDGPDAKLWGTQIGQYWWIQTFICGSTKIEQGNTTATYMMEYPTSSYFDNSLAYPGGKAAVFPAGPPDPKLNGTPTFIDKPGADLASWTQVTENRSFQAYLMYSPPDNDVSQSIWIPVLERDWTLKGTALIGSGWHYIYSIDTGSAETPHADPPNLPSWLYSTSNTK